MMSTCLHSEGFRNVDRPDGRSFRPWGAVWVSLSTGRMTVRMQPETSGDPSEIALEALAETENPSEWAAGGTDEPIATRTTIPAPAHTLNGRDIGVSRLPSFSQLALKQRVEVVLSQRILRRHEARAD